MRLRSLSLSLGHDVSVVYGTRLERRRCPLLLEGALCSLGFKITYNESCHFCLQPGPPECGGQPATLEQWDKYDLQTEKMLVSTGCVIYDAAVGSIALAVGGMHIRRRGSQPRGIFLVPLCCFLQSVQRPLRCHSNAVVPSVIHSVAPFPPIHVQGIMMQPPLSFGKSWNLDILQES